LASESSKFQLQVVAEAEWGAAAARMIESEWHRRHSALIGLPTGLTPQPFYAELRARHANGELPDAHARFAMIDDYLGAEHLATSSYQWLSREVFQPLGIESGRILRIPTDPLRMPGACAEFEGRLLRWGGCDLLFLGLGANGHVAFNEPGSEATSRTRVVRLAETTASANAAYWGGSFAPREAVTMGLGTILEARAICLLVRGAAKTDCLRAVLTGPESPELPASYLRRARRLIVLADTEAIPNAAEYLHA